jgi:hypothetical protein
VTWMNGQTTGCSERRMRAADRSVRSFAADVEESVWTVFW